MGGHQGPALLLASGCGREPSRQQSQRSQSSLAGEGACPEAIVWEPQEGLGADGWGSSSPSCLVPPPRSFMAGPGPPGLPPGLGQADSGSGCLRTGRILLTSGPRFSPEGGPVSGEKFVRCSAGPDSQTSPASSHWKGPETWGPLTASPLTLLQELTSPRLIKSHLPYRFLPSDLHNGDSKVIPRATTSRVRHPRCSRRTQVE